MGGGYAMSSGLNSDEALNYMSMPKFKGIDGPFPIVFGQIRNSTIENVFVSCGGNDAGRYDAELIEYRSGYRLWYVVLPLSATAPYKIKALNGNRVVIASKTFAQEDGNKQWQ